MSACAMGFMPLHGMNQSYKLPMPEGFIACSIITALLRRDSATTKSHCFPRARSPMHLLIHPEKSERVPISCVSAQYLLTLSWLVLVHDLVSRNVCVVPTAVGHVPDDQCTVLQHSRINMPS
jgi:hypothetical protein